MKKGSVNACYCEPDDDPVCGLPENGVFGKYVVPAGFRNREANRCGEGLPKFVEHKEES